MNRHKSNFYNCACIELLVDQGPGCSSAGRGIFAPKVHPILCGCPIRYIAENDRNERLILNADNISKAIAIIKGNGFDAQTTRRGTGPRLFYKR